GKYKVIARKGSISCHLSQPPLQLGSKNITPCLALPWMDLFTSLPNPYRYEGTLKAGETVGQAAARELEEAILREGQDTVAAFIAEPVMGVGGVVVPPDDYFPLVRQICDKYEVLFIADEVITGFGRTGEWFALKHWNVEPDILSFAKAITSGYAQLGGIQLSDAIRETMETAADTEAYMHGYTYSGHAMACAVGLKNLEIMEREEFPKRARELGKRLLMDCKPSKNFHLSVMCADLVWFAAWKLSRTRKPKLLMLPRPCKSSKPLKSVGCVPVRLVTSSHSRPRFPSTKRKWMRS
ncbi:MAG: aspartate aminotransferase family protein, partial [Lewinellaceae bacterium]|nr:aspartate aminotransferase family protein [Lewinellaceae bacterium]